MENRLDNGALKWKKAVIACILVMLFLLLLVQHSFVGLYYDDFGNASLSYGYDSSGIPGTNYTFQDLISWAKYSYNNWGGRILYALMLIPLTKYSAAAFGVIQSCIITLLFLAGYLLCSLYKERKQLSISGLIVAVLIYFSLYGDISRYGIYWASASVLYVWPVLFYLLAAWVYERACEQQEAGEKIGVGRYLAMAVLVPLVTLSQEQLGFAFVAWAALQAGLKIFRKKLKAFDLFLLGWSLATYGLFLAAPGNWIRLADSGEFAQMSIFQKIAVNVPNILKLMLNDGLRYFNVLLSGAGILMIFRNGKKGKIFRAVSLVIMAAQIAMILIPGVGTADLIIFGIFIGDMFLILLDYYRTEKRRRLLQLYISGVASVCFLIVSPSLQMRSFLPYVCFFTLLIGDAVSDFVTDIGFATRPRKILAAAAAAVLAVPALYCAEINFTGYSRNQYIQETNDSILRSYDGTADRLYLITYGDGRFRAQMPSDQGFDYISYWMKEYYNIPQSVVLVWKPLDEYLALAKKQALEYTPGDGCYAREGSFFWTANRAEIRVTNYTGAAAEAVIEFHALTGYEEMSAVSVSVNGEKTGEWQANSGGTKIEVSASLAPGENTLVIETDAKQVESGADLRTLFMRIEGLNISLK